jgi:hypothetical protein
MPGGARLVANLDSGDLDRTVALPEPKRGRVAPTF